MQGYRPDQDRDSIFTALCKSLEDNPERYQQDAAALRSEAESLSLDDFLARLNQLPNYSEGLFGQLRSIAENSSFKYSRLFAIGVYTLLEIMAPDLVKDEAKRNNALQAVADALHVPFDKLQKDLELYRSNLEKMVQAQQVMADILQADRKKKEERAKAKDTMTTPPSPPESAT
jgi:photosystem II biogenesis protein Psp29